MRAGLLLPIWGMLGTDVPGDGSNLLMLVHVLLGLLFVAAILTPCVIASQVDLDRPEP
jgi:hypothetical protein